jgi:hypothetical protein
MAIKKKENHSFWYFSLTQETRQTAKEEIGK